VVQQGRKNKEKEVKSVDRIAYIGPINTAKGLLTFTLLNYWWVPVPVVHKAKEEESYY